MFELSDRWRLFQIDNIGQMYYRLLITSMQIQMKLEDLH